MSFVHMSYLPFVLGAFGLFFFLVLFFELRYFRWIKRYWFFKRTWTNRLATFFYLLGVFLLLLSLLDLRGKELRFKAQIPDQKTIILLDTSMSMLAEDVRPNRFQRSLLLARHFVSKAVGHQISLVVFSDTQKRIVPFTDDIDLLDARLGGLENLNMDNAGSNLRQALLETVQYLREEAGEGQDVTGNILILSDGEEHGENLRLNMPENVNVAFVGVGTLQGAAIPIRSGSGPVKYFDSFKQHKGEKVLSKLDEDFIRKLGSSIRNYKYWIASSYSMPTDEILSFFRDIFKKKAAQGDVRVRPVMYEYLVLPGVLSFALGCLLSLPQTFTMVFALLFFMGVGAVQAQEEEGKKKELSPQTKIYLEKLKKGELDKVGKLKLGELLLKDGVTSSALDIYKENYKEKQSSDSAAFNYGTAQLKAGKMKEGIETLSKLRKKVESQSDSKSQELKEQIDKNIALVFSSEKQKQDNKDQQKQDQNQDQKQDQKQNQKQDQKQDQKQNKQNKQEKQDKGQQKQDKNQQQQKPQDQQDQKNKEKQDKQDKEKKDQEKKDQEKKDEEKKEQQGPKNLEEKEDQIKKQRMMKKIPAMLKELMNVDRQLQEKYIDTRTKEKAHEREKKDW